LVTPQGYCQQIGAGNAINMTRFHSKLQWNRSHTLLHFKAWKTSVISKWLVGMVQTQYHIDQSYNMAL